MSYLCRDLYFYIIYIFILELVAKEKAAPSNNTNNRIIT